MNLFHSLTGRNGPDRLRVGRRLAPPGRLYNIRYAMTARGPRREEVLVGARALSARWMRDPVTGALHCHWQAAPSRHIADTAPTPLRQPASMPRRDIHADMRPPTR